MRIDLLLAREPLGEILACTLAGYWQRSNAQTCQVQFLTKRQEREALAERQAQVWLVNQRLNAIYVSEAEAPIFAPVRQEFIRSRIWWRRPLQRAYVRAASAPLGRKRLAHMALVVTPPLPQAGQKLIVPGNHKIRILDYRQGTAVSLLKAGFPQAFMENEIEAYRVALQCALPVPEMLAIDPDGGWFVQRYLCGTPLNRLPSPELERRTRQQAFVHLRRLAEMTARIQPVGEYLDSLLGRIRLRIDDAHLLSPAEKRDWHALSQALHRRIEPEQRVKDLTLAFTHGDFQPANLLSQDDRLWIIDWEYSAERQAGYDALVFLLASRNPAGLGKRLARFASAGLNQGQLSLLEGWPGFDLTSQPSRRLHAHIFALEEIALRLEENANPLYIRPNPGLRQLGQELGTWLKN